MAKTSIKPANSSVEFFMPSRAALSIGDGSEILAEFSAKSYRALGRITLAIVKAARADDRIKLDVAFEGNKKSQKALNDLLNVVLGIKEKDPKVKGKSKIKYTEAAARYFKRNSTARTNFVHMLKKCAQAAAGINDMAAKVRMNRGTSTLIISGPVVSKEFGKDVVTLDEKMAEGLKKKPSYAAIAEIAKRNRGIVSVGGSNTRGVGVEVSSDSAFETQCKSFVRVMEQINGTPTTRQMNALRAVNLAMNKLRKFGFPIRGVP
jgi:hypothetical protein